MDDDELLTVAEVAERLRTTIQYVYGAIHSRKLPAVKLGNRYRIRWADYRAFITPAVSLRPQESRGRSAQKERIAELMRRYSGSQF